MNNKKLIILLFSISLIIIVLMILLFFSISNLNINSTFQNNFDSQKTISNATNVPELIVVDSNSVDTTNVPNFLPGYIADGIEIAEEMPSKNETSEPDSYREARENFDIDNIFGTIDNNSISNSGLLVTLTNPNDLCYVHQDNFYIEKFENNNWNVVVTSPSKGYEPNIYLDKNIPVELKINWFPICGELSSGLYRLIIHLNCFTVLQSKDLSLEFTID